MAHNRCRLLSESFLLGISQSRRFSNCCFRRIFARFCLNCRWNTFRCVRSHSRATPCVLFDQNTRIIADGKRSKNTLSSSKGAWTQTTKSIESYLKQKEIKYNHGHTSIIAQCPFCALGTSNTNKAPGGQSDGVPMTLFVNKTTGSHVCNSCGTSGTWSEFKYWMNEKRTAKNAEEAQVPSVPDIEKVTSLWKKTRPFGECKESLRRYVSKRLEIQPLSAETLKFYKVHTILHQFAAQDGSQRQQLCLAFPWYDYERQKICGIKLHKVNMRDEETQITVEPRHGSPSMFGWHTVSADTKEIVLTADEFDAMAVYEATSFPSISLPLGLSSLPPEVLPHLEQFEKIILWFGNDVRSRQAANKFARKLNIQRCHFVRSCLDVELLSSQMHLKQKINRMDTSGPTNALDALRKGHNLTNILAEAQAASHKQIVTFQQIRDDVYNELCNADQVAGVKWTRFPKLSEILKGHRRGELTVFTGPTGAGKTTLLSELSVDLCMQSKVTSWPMINARARFYTGKTGQYHIPQICRALTLRSNDVGKPVAHNFNDPKYFPLEVKSIISDFWRYDVCALLASGINIMAASGVGETYFYKKTSPKNLTQVNTLWGSFEVRNVRLAKTMLNQFSGLNMERSLPQYNYWAEKFEMLPMYFMSFYGAQNLKDVIETMSHAAYVYDIEHVIVDNLQFMISNSYSPDRFYAQNVAIAEFRKFATAKNVHVTLVIHPRKESDDAELQTASIFGSAKASQESDNVIILQDKKGKSGKYLQVTKNRFDGTLGKVYLDFDRESLTMSTMKRENVVKKESRSIQSVKPPKTTAGGTTTKKTRVETKERITPVLQDGNVLKSVGVTNKQKGTSGTSKDKQVNSGPPGTSLTSVSRSNARNNQESKQVEGEQSKGIALSSKATGFNGGSSQKPVLTGKKIAVKQLDVDDVYLQ